MDALPKTRLVWIDVLNIISCAGVVLLHCTNQEIWDFKGVNDSFILGLFTHSFVLWPVDVFFMLSGYTLMKKNTDILAMVHKDALKSFWKRRVDRLLIPVFFWNIVYGFLYVKRFLIYSEPVDLKSFIIKFLQLDFIHYFWFLIPLLGVYMVAPYLSIICNALDRRKFTFFFWLCFILVTIPRTLGPIVYIDSYEEIFPLGTQYMLMAIAGYYFGNYNPSKKSRYIIYALALISMIMTFVFSYILYQTEKEYYQVFIDYYSITCVMAAIGVFVFIKNVDWEKTVINVGILAKISVLCLGVYLIHSLIIGIYTWYDLGDTGLLEFSIVFPICLLCIFIIKKIPILKYVV